MAAQLLSIHFNQDYSCLSVGTSRGFRVFALNPFREIYTSELGGVRSVNMLFSTPLVALVGSGQQPHMSPRQVHLYDLRTSTTIFTLNSFASTVLGVRMNAKRMVVAQEKRVDIFDLNTMKFLHSLETPRNPHGLLELSSSDQCSTLVVPASDSVGEVFVFDALNLKVLNLIAAHDSPIRAMAISFDGSLLATCSNTGTLIRVFSLPKGNRIRTFRRGTRPASVWSLSFSQDNKFLCLTSDSQSVHVFSMDEQVEPDTSDDANQMIGDIDAMPKPSEPVAEQLSPSDFVEQPLDEATQQQMIEHGQRAEAAVSALSASLVLDQNRPDGDAEASASESSDALPAGNTTDIVSSYASAFVSTSSAALTSLSTSIGSFLSSASSSIADKMPDLSGVAAAAAAGARGLISNYAPSRASEWADAERSCSQIQLKKSSDVRVISAIDSKGVLHVASADGLLTMYGRVKPNADVPSENQPDHRVVFKVRNEFSLSAAPSEERGVMYLNQ